MASIPAAQAYMREQKIDGWLIYDFRGSNSVLPQLLPGKRWTTRRALLFVPATGAPVLLVHSIDQPQFEKTQVRREVYLSWRDLIACLANITTGRARLAMEYSPGGLLPAVSMADAGTVELVRAMGIEVVSSANLIQACVATWTPEARAAHDAASAAVGRIKDDAFGLIRKRITAGQSLNEYEVQQQILQGFAAAGLETSEPPIVAVNAHSGDPHFEVSATSPAPIRRGDWVLIDLWARQPGDENIYSDITWVGFVGDRVPPKQQEVYKIVKAARDAALQRAVQAWQAGERLQGWQLDDAARQVIIDAGYERYIRHRTGHSLSPGPLVHGLGVNIDNLETHDTRDVLPRLGYTIEPGIYLPEFGVRLEIDVFVDPQRGPTVTSVLQDEVVLLA
jgi:Xaa-Pro aminopeptidase